MLTGQQETLMTTVTAVWLPTVSELITAALRPLQDQQPFLHCKNYTGCFNHRVVTLGADKLETVVIGQGLGKLHKATGPDHHTDHLGNITTGCHGKFMPFMAAEMFSG